MARALWHVETAGERRVARGGVDAPVDLLVPALGWDELVRGGPDAVAAALADDAATEPVPAHDELVVLPPVAGQELWAAGVTYERSKQARMEESGDPDHYDRVYAAERPELFHKAAGWRVRGPGAPIGIRADATWSVPEPELAIVVDPSGRILGATIGNDVSSRDIEGANPLYLPQAKSYTDSAALGPCMVVADDVGAWSGITITLEVARDGAVVLRDEVSTDLLRRSPQELVDWLVGFLRFPDGVVLMTGTAIVPPSAFTLLPGDVVRIASATLGELTNDVHVVGRPVGTREP